MDEHAEIQAKIAAIAGQINKHKQHQHPEPFTPAPRHHQPRQLQPPYNPRDRWSPYPCGGRAGHPQQYKHRTLVLGGNQSSPPRASEAASSDTEILAEAHAPAGTFVSARGYGTKKLMNKDTHEREAKQYQEIKENARAAKRQKIDREERSTLMHHVQASSTSDTRELMVDGIRFQLRDDGSKLIRVLGKPLCEISDARLTHSMTADVSTASKETPKRAKIADVDFHRTKHGNLVRSNAVRQLLRYRPLNNIEMSDHDLLCSHTRTPSRKDKPQCENFTKHGTKSSLLRTARLTTEHHCHGKNSALLTNICLGKCSFGPRCNFSHDPNKVAICKTLLRSGSCPDGDNCDLSHVTTYHRVPACTHFLHGTCTKPACQYPHVHVHISSSAPVCRAFASLGYCDDGESCTKRHVFECPDYANNGFCANHESGKCTLPHIDRAGVLRKAAARQAGSGEEPDLSSDDEMHDDNSGMDDIDSDEAEDVIMGGFDDDHALSQQQDFIALS